MAAKSLYDLLEVSPGASNEAIEAAFRRLVDALKPRAAGGEEAAIVQLQALHEAHRTLTDPVRRERYDRVVAARTAAVSAPVEAEADPSPVRWLIAVALAALLVAGGGWYFAHKSQVERQRVEAELREKAKAEELARLEAERERRESSAAARAERDAARQQRAEELQYQRWVEKNRRDADRIQQQNAYAERHAQAQEAREARRIESERQREIRQRELEQQREDAAAMRRLEEEKRRLQELQRANGTY